MECFQTKRPIEIKIPEISLKSWPSLAASNLKKRIPKQNVVVRLEMIETFQTLFKS